MKRKHPSGRPVKVLVTSHTHPDGLAVLHEAGFEVVHRNPSLSPAELEAELSKDSYHAIVAGNTALTAAAIDAGSPSLQIVSRHGVGYGACPPLNFTLYHKHCLLPADGIDTAHLTSKTIPLMVVGTANSTSVAEHTLMLMLALSRKLLQWDAETRRGNYLIRDQCNLCSIEGKHVLIVGFGRIGTRVAARCIAFGMKVTVCDPHVPGNTVVGMGYEYISDISLPLTKAAAEVLKRIDYITLHLPALPDGEHFLRKEHLDALKPGGFVINTARGTLVDETALLAALKSGHVAGAGLDVFNVEPPLPSHPLFVEKSDLNLIVSPHAAPNTKETNRAVGLTVCGNIVDFFAGAAKEVNCINREVLTAAQDRWAAGS